VRRRAGEATTGGGVYYGVLGAGAAAETLKKSFSSGDFSAQGLAAYEEGWQKLIGKELTTGWWARRLYSRSRTGR